MPSSKLLIFAALVSLASFTLSGYNLWNQKNTTQVIQEQAITTTPTPIASPVMGKTDLDAFKLSVLASQAAELEKRLTLLENKKVPASNTIKNAARETVLYMGTGSSTSRDWTAIDAAGITFDISSYGKVKEVRFEAALSIISGEVSARLMNKTTGAVYYNSAVMHNKSSSEWRTSSAIQLPSGNNQYVVELRSSNNERANLDGSRLKILVE